MSFNTVEDVNGAMFDHQGFWWYELDTACIDPTGEAEFTDVKVDFCTISKESYNSNLWLYTVEVDNDLWTKGFQVQYDTIIASITVKSTSPLQFTINKGLDASKFKFRFYMGNTPYSDVTLMTYSILDYDLVVYSFYSRIGKNSLAYVWKNGERYEVEYVMNIGYNQITYDGTECGHIFVKLLKTDFQFTCNQDLIVGEVNTVQLGTATDYKPNGDLVGEYETKLSVLYNGETIPVVWNESVNDYTFDLDLSDKINEGKVRFKVIVETNEVLNYSENDVVLNANFESIDTLDKLKTLVSVGGIGRLSSDLTLTSDLMLSKSVNLVGNSNRIDLSSHKIIVPSDLTFKAQDISFTNGVNSIQQYSGSSVDLTNCSFSDCIGIGSVIDCQVDISSLELEDDFTTSLSNCTFTNNDMCILHGGNLEVTRCTINGKISNKNYPFFLYQTDGNATILNSEFNLTDNTVYDYDIEFNSCIFTCGETATINGYSHTELQNNNMSAFFDTQRNTSTIDIQYYYSLIEANVRLQSNKGYCHSVSNVDYIFKSNVTITRGE